MNVIPLRTVRPETNEVHLTLQIADPLQRAALEALESVRIQVVMGSLTGKRGVLRGWDPASPFATIEVDPDLDDPTYHPGEFVKLSKTHINVIPG